jgi:hypothetical protein
VSEALRLYYSVVDQQHAFGIAEYVVCSRLLLVNPKTPLLCVDAQRKKKE